MISLSFFLPPAVGFADRKTFRGKDLFFDQQHWRGVSKNSCLVFFAPRHIAMNRRQRARRHDQAAIRAPRECGDDALDLAGNGVKERPTRSLPPTSVC
jgi:hypothetical protein